MRFIVDAMFVTAVCVLFLMKTTEFFLEHIVLSNMLCLSSPSLSTFSAENFASFVAYCSLSAEKEGHYYTTSLN